MKTRSIKLLILLAALGLVVGCSNEPDLTAPDTGTAPHNPYLSKDGTEVLGPPLIDIASGSGFAEGGVGMTAEESAELTIDVPAGAQVVQALLYWAGGSNNGSGDQQISLDGNFIDGNLIGGPTLFYGSYEFYSYRADITGLGLVGPGPNTFTVADFDFVGGNNENSGASILVIYDDGTVADLSLRDGLDMAYFGFVPTLDATVPQVFEVNPENVDRTADLLLLVASVGENRPTTVQVTTSAGYQIFEDVLGSTDGDAWDSLVLTVDVPANADELSVQVISTPDQDPQGASLGWVAAGLALQPAEVEMFAVDGIVFEDASRDEFYDGIEWGIGGVVLELNDAGGTVATATSDFLGNFQLEAPAGDYTLEINLTGYPDDFNADLAAYFEATTPLSIPVTIGPANTGNFFGFTPLTEELVADLESGGLASDASPLEYWTQLFRRALIEERSNRQANGHDNGHDNGNGNGGGWGHDENYFSPDELRDLLTLIEGYYIEIPYQFTDGMELEEVYEILKRRPRTDGAKLYRELLVTELNFAAGYGIIGQEDVLGVLISWGESLLAGEDEKSGDKSRQGDIRFALELFGVINTGGGGGVDE